MSNDDPAHGNLMAEDEEGGEQEAVVIIPLAQDIDSPIPALRDIRAQVAKLGANGEAELEEGAEEIEDKTVVVLADPEGIAPEPAMLSPSAFALASLFDGRRSARQAAQLLSEQVGQPVAPKNVLELQCKLDAALFLYSEHFEKTVRRQLRSYLGKTVRPAVHAGSAYPADPELLQQTVAAYFTGRSGPGAPWPAEPQEGALAQGAAAPAGETPALRTAAVPAAPEAAAGDTLRSLILPHIDLRVGGATYAHGYAELLRNSQADLFVILGVAHQSNGSGLYYVSQKDFATPLGPVQTERGIARRLQAAADVEPMLAELAHRTEHSVEFQAVLLAATMARCKREFEIVPVLCGPVEAFLAADNTPFASRPFQKFTAALRKELEESKRKWCVLCSVDLSHVGPEFGNSTIMTPHLLRPVERFDRKLLGLVARLDVAAFYDEIQRTQNSRHVDAVMAVLTMLHACRGMLKGGRLLRYDRLLKDGSHSAVTYASMAFE